MSLETYPGRPVSRAGLAGSGVLLAVLGVVSIVLLRLGGVARLVGAAASTVLVLGFAAFVYRFTKAGGNLKVSSDLVAFGGNRVYVDDIESVEREPAGPAGGSFRVRIATRYDRTFVLDLMDYRMEPDEAERVFDRLRNEVARRRGSPAD